MADITTLLHAAASGDRAAADAVVAGLYQELRQIARGRLHQARGLDHLDTTGLVHEGWLRLQDAAASGFADRRHYLAYAARAMRSVVVDLVRAARAQRAGGAAEHLTLDTTLADQLVAGDPELLRVHEALDALAEAEPRLAQVVEMRYFGGLTEAEIAEVLAVTERTVQRDWRKARLYLAEALA